MIVCKSYEPSLKSLWDSFVDNSKTPLFFFKRDFVEYHRDRFEDASLMFYDDEKLVAILPASVSGAELVSHGGLTFGGFLLGSKARASSVIELLASLKAECRSRKLTSIIYKSIPYIFFQQPSQEDLYALFRSGAAIEKRDLSSVIDLQCRPKKSKGRKWLINRAKKEQLTVVESNDWQDFHDLLSTVLSKHNAKPVHSPVELEYLHTRFPEQISLRIARKDDVNLAATLLFRFEGVTHTQYMATSDEGKHLGALDYLIEECIEEAIQQSQRYFSFGVSTEQGGQILNEGLIAQKEGFGARSVIIDTYRLQV